jgi:hypothetical protein
VCVCVCVCVCLCVCVYVRAHQSVVFAQLSETVKRSQLMTPTHRKWHLLSVEPPSLFNALVWTHAEIRRTRSINLRGILLLPHLCQTCHSRESICFATNTHTHAVLSHHGREACSQPHLPVPLLSSRLTHICQSHTRWHCYHDVNCAFPLSVYLLGIQQHTSSRTHSTKPNTSSVNLALSDLQSHLLSPVPALHLAQVRNDNRHARG